MTPSTSYNSAPQRDNRQQLQYEATRREFLTKLGERLRCLLCVLATRGSRWLQLSLALLALVLALLALVLALLGLSLSLAHLLTR